ncbi:MAG: sigma-70 family RNA polymerase sigma factor [Acidimicrobiales bacterium]
MDTSAPSDPARRRAFEEAVAEVYEPVQRYLRRRCPADDADEVLNDTLLTIWRRLDDLPVERRLPWTYGVARRCLANHRRGTIRRLRLADKTARTAATECPDPWTNDADAALHDAMARLGDDDREIVRLWAWERLEAREIAEVLGTSANAVSVRLSRIRRRLDEEVSRQNHAPAGHERFDGHTKEDR